MSKLNAAGFIPALEQGAYVQSSQVFGKYKAVTASYTLLANSGLSTACDGTIEAQTAGITLTLPSTASAGEGQTYVVKNTSGGTVTLAAHSGQTIFTTSAVSSVTLQSGDSYTVQSNGTNWLAI